MTIYYESSLYHHGIKGMKWGVRRFQNKHGTLTSEGKKRYGDSEQKTNLIDKHRNNLINKYKSKGYSQSAAETAAKQRMKTELVIGAIGTVAVGVVAKKAVTRIGQDYFDKTINKGAVIQNIGPNGQATFKDAPFFAAINKNDKRAYGNMYANEKRYMVKRAEAAGGRKYEGIYNNQIQITDNIKRASVKNARDAFYDKMDNDPEFKKNVLKTIKETNYGKGVAQKAVNNYEKNGTRSKEFYDRFNQALATPQFQEAGIHKQYYSELQKRGYNAILDINDTRYSGYKGIAKSPTIFFGDAKWEKIGSTKLSEADIDKNLMNYVYGTRLPKIMASKVAKYGIAYAGVRTIRDAKIINSYLSKHPNSKLSREEIIKRYKNGTF